MNRNEEILAELKLRYEEKLPNFIHFSWCTVELNNANTSLLTVEMLDDLYCGLVSGVLCNLGSGKTPEYMDGVGPSEEERFTKERYEIVWFELIGLICSANPIEQWLIAHPESEQWIDYLDEGMKLQIQFDENPEQWLVNFRTKLSQKQQEKWQASQ
jgi:hypothetical protein